MALGCMEHRGGCSADNDSGDGAGLLTNVPWELFKRDLPDLKEAHTGCAGCLTRRSNAAPCCPPCSSAFVCAQGVTKFAHIAASASYTCNELAFVLLHDSLLCQSV